MTSQSVVLLCTVGLLFAWTDTVGAQTVFLIPLEGSQEVPPVTTEAEGVCVGTLSEDQTQFEVVCRHDVQNVTAAHIHTAPAGENGGVRHGFDSAASPMQMTVDLTTDADFVSELEAGNLYINVHSEANPGGEIRGQITDPAPGALTFALEPEQEVPPTDSTASGECAAVVSGDRTELTVACVHDIGDATAAHIHNAPRGSNAGVVFPFDAGTSPIIGVASTDVDPNFLEDLIGEAFYVNVHSPANPGGEIRGQIPNPFRTLFFSQFGNGGGLASDIVIVNPSATLTLDGEIHFSAADGVALELGLQLPEQAMASSSSFSIEPLGSLTISTDGQGDLAQGSARVTTLGNAGGFIRFSIQDLGIAGVSEGAPAASVIVPVRRTTLESGLGVNTGIAVRNTGNRDITVDLSLRNAAGATVDGGTASVTIAARGRISNFFQDLLPDAATEDFEGTVVVTAQSGEIAAIALEFVGSIGQAGGSVTTLPVTEVEN